MWCGRGNQEPRLKVAEREGTLGSVKMVEWASPGLVYSASITLTKMLKYLSTCLLDGLSMDLIGIASWHALKLTK